MSYLDKDRLQVYFELWNDLNENIERNYNEKNKQAVILMEQAIQNYENLLEAGGKEVNVHTGKEQLNLLPLNGEERLAFVKDKIASHYAYVQLDALYTEAKKKVARISAMR